MDKNLNLEINKDYVLVKRIDENPYRLQKTDGGLILPNGSYLSEETGEFETAQTFISYCEVVKVGPTCQFAKEGDKMYYDQRSAIPVPYKMLGLFKVHEGALLVKVLD